MTNLIDHVIVILNIIDGSIVLQIVTLSPKYQVVIPKAVRNSLQLRSGQKIQVIEYNGRIVSISQNEILMSFEDS